MAGNSQKKDQLFSNIFSLDFFFLFALISKLFSMSIKSLAAFVFVVNFIVEFQICLMYVTAFYTPPGNAVLYSKKKKKCIHPHT